MCQLLGLSSNKNVDIQFSLLEFRHRGEKNPHGWGFAFNQDEDWKVFKEPSSLSIEDVRAETFQFKSKVIIGHVRLASCGDHTHQNTHPFKIDNWIFAHNGTVREIIEKAEFKLRSYKPEGKTDSEYAFCYLLEKIGAGSGIVKDVLEAEAEKIKQFGNFNFLLSDGKTIFAHGDNSLYFVQRKSPFTNVTLRDEQYSVDLKEIKSPDEKAILITTKKLTENENWQKISGIKVFRDGKEIWE